MPTAKLIKSRSLHTQGMSFAKNKVTPVSYEVARALKDDPRFKVEFDAADVATEQAESEGGRPLDKATRLALIQEAIGQLDEDNEENFTSTGKPDARALTSALGWQVTSKERDEAMANEVSTGETLGQEAPASRRRPGGPVLQPGESSETPVRGKDTGDLAEGDIKNPINKTTSQGGRTKIKLAPATPDKPNIEGAKPEDSEAPSETGEEQTGEKKVGGVTIKHKAADPTTEEAKEI